MSRDSGYPTQAKIGPFDRLRAGFEWATVPNDEMHRCGATSRQGYAAGSYDFLAAYIVPEDVWYIIPAEVYSTAWSRHGYLVSPR